MSLSSFSEMLRIYYKRLFPYDPFFQWLQYGGFDKNYLANREFSFTLEDDVYVRFQSFCTQEDFEKEIKSRVPHKIDIGAVYTLKPREHRLRNQFQPLEKEMVFDIDMTDYDEVRSCCSGADVCVKCWKFMAIACKILDEALEDFGWKHKLWVFSGRRGIHCWVCDESARKLDVSERAAVAEYLQVITGGEKQYKKVILKGDSLHPLIRRSLDIIEPYFENMVMVEQNALGTNEGCVKFLRMITDESLKNSTEREFKLHKNSIDRWIAFKNIALSTNKQSGNRWRTRYIVEEIMLQYTYPRLDIHVSKGLNHLLKAPFCVHPKTGKVCVPFSPKTVDNFDPTTVPTIDLLTRDIDEYDAKRQALGDTNVKVKDYKKTSMNQSMAVFDKFLNQMQQDWKEKKRQTENCKMEF